MRASKRDSRPAIFIIALFPGWRVDGWVCVGAAGLAGGGRVAVPWGCVIRPGGTWLCGARGGGQACLAARALSEMEWRCCRCLGHRQYTVQTGRVQNRGARQNGPGLMDLRWRCGEMTGRSRAHPAGVGNTQLEEGSASGLSRQAGAQGSGHDDS